MTNYELGQAEIAQRRAALNAQRENLKAGGDADLARQNRTTPGTPEATPVDPFSGGAASPQDLASAVANNPLNRQSVFEQRFNPVEPGAGVPVGHQDLGSVDRYGRQIDPVVQAQMRQSAQPTAANLAAAPFTEAATQRDWMPDQDKYNQYLISRGISPNTIGGVPVVNGRIIPPSIPQLDKAMANADALTRMHGDLINKAHRARTFEKNSERAAAFEDEAAKFEPYIGHGIEQARAGYLAELSPALKLARNTLGIASAPDINVLRQQLEQKPQLVQQPVTAPQQQPGQKTADDLKKKQGQTLNAPS